MKVSEAENLTCPFMSNQWRKCEVCNKIQYRSIGYADGANSNTINEAVKEK